MPKIKVIAVVYGAINALNHMIDCGMHDMDFIAVSSDAMGLKSSKASIKILLGENRHIGLGMLPMPIYREFVEEAKDTLKNICVVRI